MSVSITDRAELNQFRAHGTFPEGHSALVNECLRSLGLMTGARILVLGCGMGLLVKQLHWLQVAECVMGLDRDASAIAMGRKVYPEVELHRSTVEMSDLLPLIDFLKLAAINVVVAPRTLPIIAQFNDIALNRLSAAIMSAGVRVMIIQGTEAGDRLGKINAQVRAVGDFWAVHWRRGSIAVLRARA